MDGDAEPPEQPPVRFCLRPECPGPHFIPDAGLFRLHGFLPEPDPVRLRRDRHRLRKGESLAQRQHEYGHAFHHVHSGPLRPRPHEGHGPRGRRYAQQLPGGPRPGDGGRHRHRHRPVRRQVRLYRDPQHRRHPLAGHRHVRRGFLRPQHPERYGPHQTGPRRLWDDELQCGSHRHHDHPGVQGRRGEEGGTGCNPPLDREGYAPVRRAESRGPGPDGGPHRQRGSGRRIRKGCPIHPDETQDPLGRPRDPDRGGGCREHDLRQGRL